MAGTRLIKFFTSMIAVTMALAVVGSADAVDSASHKVVALRRGMGAFDLFQSNSELSSVFTDALPGVPIDPNTSGTGGNGNIDIINNVVDDSVLWGLADPGTNGIGTGIQASGNNTWDDAGQFGSNFGTTPESSFFGAGARMSLLRFDVALASGLVDPNTTIVKAELRLFFDGGSGPGDGNGSRNPGSAGDDKVGRITTFDWVEGNKDRAPPGTDVTDPNGVILIPGALGVSRRHPESTNTGGQRDINNVDGELRTSGRWFDPDGVIGGANADPNQLIYKTVLGSDYNNDGFVNGEDLQRWEDDYGSTTDPTSGFNWRLPRGDDNVNGIIDGKDFLGWQRNAGKIGVGILVDPNSTLDAGVLRGWFGTENPAGDVTYSAPTWGDGNDLFNPYPVDYTNDPNNFPLVTIDGVQIYSPSNATGSTQYPVSPIDGVSPGDGDPNTEVNSLDASSIGDPNGTANFDYAGGFSETGGVGGSAGFDVWDITEIVQLWAAGESNFGLYVADNLRTFAMSETLYGLDFAPVLFIEYTTNVGAVAVVPEPASLVWLGLAGLAGLARRRRRA